MKITLTISPRRVVAAFGTVALIGLAVASCSATPSGQAQENNQQQGFQQTYETTQPVHANPTSQIRQTLQDVEDATEKSVATTSFVFELGDPDPVETCSSIGVPVAANDSLTNPEQISGGYAGGGSNYGIGVIGQMDPNGIYVSPSTEGTYVMCVNPQGQNEVTYAEGHVETVFGAATWDKATRSIVMSGPSSFAFKTLASK